MLLNSLIALKILRYLHDGMKEFGRNTRNIQLTNISFPRSFFDIRDLRAAGA